MGRNVLVKQKTAKKLARFSKNLFSEKIKSYQRKIEKYLTDFSVLKLSKEHILECENVILEKKKSWYPKRDAINKSTNSDRLTKEFYFTFYE